MKSAELKKEFKEKIEKTQLYKKTPEEKATWDFFVERKKQLQCARKESGIEDIWKQADTAYIPHTIDEKGKKVFASDDEKGMRSAQVILTKDTDWQEASVPPNPYVKIQTALGIIVDRNPGASLNAGAKKYQKNSVLMENLYSRNWEIAHSKSACLKPFVLNCGKYGFAVGRTFPLTIRRELRNGKTVVVYQDVFRENLSPWQCWIDDSAKVGNPLSVNDNVYYKDYSWDKFREQFRHLDNYKYVKPEKQILLDENEEPAKNKGKQEKIAKYQIRVWFYENLDRDLLFITTDDGIPLVVDEIPKREESKMLSLWFAPWTLRDDSSIYGIGIYEAMRNDHKLQMKIRNMTMDQVVQSIYKSFFYEGTDTLQSDGVMTNVPGQGRQVLNPQNIKWNEVPGPGAEAWKGLEYQDKKMEETSGVSRSLSGEIVGKTAFETSQARESAMKRLKIPLENITEALEQDAYITLAIIEDMYSLPKIKLIAEDRYIEAAELKEMVRENEGLEYEEEAREIPLNVEEDEKGNYTASRDENFIQLKPENLSWRGTIKIKGQSMIANSELLERVSTVEMANIIVPLFAQDPAIAEKPAREIIKQYDKDPEDWLPEAWLNPPQQEKTPLFIPAGQEGEQEGEAPQGNKPQTIIPQSQINSPSNAMSNIKDSISKM